MKGLLYFFESKRPVNEFNCHIKTLIVGYFRLNIVGIGIDWVIMVGIKKTLTTILLSSYAVL